MNFLNPDEKTRIKIRKAEAPKPAPAPGAVVPGKGPVAGAKPGLPGAKPGVPTPAAKPAVPGAKPASPLAATVKAKLPPKVQVLQVEPGIFEVHFSCSCGEEYIIRCDSATGAAEKSSQPPVP